MKSMEFPDNATEQEVIDYVGGLAADKQVNGILVQLPLPSHMNEEKVPATIGADKDVDGLLPSNIADLVDRSKDPKFVACTPFG